MLAALAAAGPVLGGDPEPVPYSGELEDGGTISFTVVNKNPKVRDIDIEDIYARCERSKALLSFFIFGKTPVLDNRRFAVFSRDPEGRGKAIVEGRFSKSFRRAKGTARLYGSYRLEGEGWQKCETGKQEFVATIPQ